jgi:hypothetical protein
VAGTRAPVTVLSSTEVLARARSEGDLAYFYFSAPEVIGDSIRLTLMLKLAPADPNRRSLGLGGIQVTFKHTDGRLEVVGDPVMFAM